MTDNVVLHPDSALVADIAGRVYAAYLASDGHKLYEPEALVRLSVGIARAIVEAAQRP